MNVRLDIEYDGALYSGWQVQKNHVSVQGEIEKALALILRQKIRVTGAGRTDAGVHALGQVAHFKADRLPVSLSALRISLNGILKAGITICRVRKVNDTFHARYSAKWRTYQYRISLRKRSVDRHLYYVMPYAVNVSRMRRAAARLRGKHDFKDLSVDKSGKSTMCHVKKLTIQQKKDEILLTVTANRFLHKMVRMTAGLLIDIGRGKLPVSCVDDIFKPGGPARKPGFCAPPQGLCLHKIQY